MRYFITSLLLSSAIICNAQRHVLKFRTIIGIVTDKNNQPLTNCTVMFAGNGMGSATDSKGRFKFNFPDETMMLIINNWSDNDQKYYIKVTSDQQTLDIKLDKSTEDASERNFKDWKQNEAIYTNRILQAIQSEELHEYVHNGQKRTNDEFTGSNIDVISPPDSNWVFSYVEQEPMFGKGSADWLKYIQVNLRYPTKARQDSVQGKVYVIFIVERDGSVTNIQILRSLSPECDKEAIRLIQNSPKWKSGIQAGKIVRCQYTYPIKFKL